MLQTATNDPPPLAASGAAPGRRGALAMLALIIAAAAALFLVGNDRVSLWDRDEPRYAQCSRQMLQSGDWVVPMYLDKWRTEKPPLIYWCQAAAMTFLGDNSFAARLPSAAAMTVLLIVLAIAVYRAIGPSRAVWTVAILSSTALTYWTAKTCLTDAVLLLFTTLAQLGLYAIYRGRSSWLVVLSMWLAVALGGMIKGPIILATIIPTAIALAAFDHWQRLAAFSGTAVPPVAQTSQHRRTVLHRLLAWFRRLFLSIILGSAHAARTWWRKTRPLVGLVILALVIGPWMYLLHVRAPGFLEKLFNIAAKHVGTSMENHGGPPGYHAASIFIAFFPWSLLLPAALVIAFKHRNLPPVRFALAAVIGPWVVVEIISTKLPHYFLCAYPPLAFLCADVLVRCIRRQHNDLHRPLHLVAVAVWCLVPLAICAGVWAPLMPHLQLTPPPLPRILGYAMLAMTLIAGTWAVAVFYLFRIGRPQRAAAAMFIGMALLIGGLFGVYLPNATFLQLAPQLGAELQRQGATRVGDVIMIDYKEPSLAFYQGGTIREQDHNHYLHNTDPALWPRWIVLTRDIWQTVPQDRKALLRQTACFRGLNPADKGRVRDVMIMEKQ